MTMPEDMLAHNRQLIEEFRAPAAFRNGRCCC